MKGKILIVDDEAPLRSLLKEAIAGDYITAEADSGAALKKALAGDPVDVVLLDLNLPGLDGCQVLTQIKSDPCLRMIPVVILTTSHREEDILQTYLAGANTYIPKPAEYPSYCELVATLRRYWVDTALKVPYQLRRKLAAAAAKG